MSGSTGRPASTSRSPPRREVGDLATPRHGHEEARELALVDVALEVPVDPLEPGPVEADVRRVQLDRDRWHGLTLWRESAPDCSGSRTPGRNKMATGSAASTPPHTSAVRAP